MGLNKTLLRKSTKSIKDFEYFIKSNFFVNLLFFCNFHFSQHQSTKGILAESPICKVKKIECLGCVSVLELCVLKHESLPTKSTLRGESVSLCGNWRCLKTVVRYFPVPYPCEKCCNRTLSTLAT